MAKKDEGKSNWGGAREGAGRPRRKRARSTESITFRITKEEMARLQTQILEGVSHNHVARELFLEALERRVPSPEGDSAEESDEK